MGDPGRQVHFRLHIFNIVFILTYNIKDTIHEDAVIFPLILYADKTKLSSFGKEQGYPVIARCGCLPLEIRNSNNGVGGGRVVGWLPIVSDNDDVLYNDMLILTLTDGCKVEGEVTADKDPTAIANHRRQLWHQGLRIILKPIKRYTQYGGFFPCADEVNRHVVVAVIVLSMDYEEA